MTRKEIVLKSIHHRETETCPYTLDFEVDSGLEALLDDHYGSSEWRNRYRNYVVKAPGMPDGRGIWEPGPAYRTDYFGTVWRMDLKPVHVETPAMAEADLSAYAFPELSRFMPDEWRARFDAFAAENRDRLTVVYTGFGLFERSWMLRGFEQALTDSALEPEFYAGLIEAIAEEHFLPLIDRLVELPVDGIMFGDDWGDQRGVIVGPDRWRSVFKPLYRRLYDRVHAAGKIAVNHVCGSIIDIIGDLIDIGLDVLESVQVEARGMDPYALKREFGSNICFWGGLGSQSTIPFGTPEEVRTEIRRLASEMSRGGGYILSCAKALQQGTPVENAAVILEEFVAAGAGATG